MTTLDEYHWKVDTCTTADCRKKFSNFIASEKWALIEPGENEPIFMRIPEWFRTMLKDITTKLCLSNIIDIKKDFTEP